MRACALSYYLSIYISSTYREHNEPGSTQVERKHYVIPGGRQLFIEKNMGVQHLVESLGKPALLILLVIP
jgi:hypothetical protein